MASILVVEDSRDSIVLIERALGLHRLEIASTIAEASQLLEQDIDFDLMLLDLNLPDGDGLTLCSRLSKAGETRIPIVFLTARSDVRDKVAAFSLGAEDYIEKPFDLLELQARVSSRLRKLEAARGRGAVLQRGDLRVDVASMRVFCERADRTEELDLSPTEHRVLQALVEQPGSLVTRERMMARIWGDTVVGSRTIDSHVSNLRAKLRGTRGEIDAVRGLGYRFRIGAKAPSSSGSTPSMR